MNTAGKLVVGVDIAKNAFQVYTVDKETGEAINKPIKRAQFLNGSQIAHLASSGWKHAEAPSTGRVSSRIWGTRSS